MAGPALARTGNVPAPPLASLRAPASLGLALPLVLRAPAPTPTPSAPCDKYEPNDVIAHAWGPLHTWQWYFAKLCLGDPEDNYYVDTVTTNKVSVRIMLPPTLMAGATLRVYGPGTTNAGSPDHTWTVTARNQTFTFNPTTVGRYVVRFTSSGHDNLTPYQLIATYY